MKPALSAPYGFFNLVPKSLIHQTWGKFRVSDAESITEDLAGVLSSPEERVFSGCLRVVIGYSINTPPAYVSDRTVEHLPAKSLNGIFEGWTSISVLWNSLHYDFLSDMFVYPVLPPIKNTTISLSAPFAL